MKKLVCLFLSIAVIFLLASCVEKSSPIEDFEFEIVDGEIIITDYLGTEREIYVPSEINERPVTEIGEEAVSEYDMVHISLPDTIKRISERALEGCKCLESIDFSNSLEYIETYAFSRCETLKNVTFPDSLSGISDYAFSRCISLTELRFPEKLESIRDGAFEGCDALNSVFLPNNLKNLGFDAFGKCESLKELKIPDDTEMKIAEYEQNLGSVGVMHTFKSPVGSSNVSYYFDAYSYAQDDETFEKLPTVLIVNEGSHAHEQVMDYETYGLQYVVK